MCTTRFYNRNVAGLKDKYRVITLDSRGYGLSSKSLVGNNLRQHAQDVKDLIDYSLHRRYLLRLRQDVIHPDWLCSQSG